MKLGKTKADKPTKRLVKKGAGKAALHIVGIGLAAGLALITATDKGMRKFTGYEDEAPAEAEEE